MEIAEDNRLFRHQWCAPVLSGAAVGVLLCLAAVFLASSSQYPHPIIIYIGPLVYLMMLLAEILRGVPEATLFMVLTVGGPLLYTCYAYCIARAKRWPLALCIIATQHFLSAAIFIIYLR